VLLLAYLLLDLLVTSELSRTEAKNTFASSLKLLNRLNSNDFSLKLILLYFNLFFPTFNLCSINQ
jgi:hypothetical protein